MRYAAERHLDNTDDSITTSEVVATAQLSADHVLSLAVDYPRTAEADAVIDAAVGAMVDAVIDAIDYPGVRQVVTRPVDPQHLAQQQKRSTEATQEAMF